MPTPRHRLLIALSALGLAGGAHAATSKTVHGYSASTQAQAARQSVVQLRQHTLGPPVGAHHVITRRVAARTLAVKRKP